MFKKVRLLVGTITVCLCLASASYGAVENSTAHIYEGNVRINTLQFDNGSVKEPLLLYKGSYYLPMTSEVMANLGIHSSMTDEGYLAFSLVTPEITGEMQSMTSVETPEIVDIVPYTKEMKIGDVLIRPDEGFHPIVVYNNTFYVPLNAAVVEQGLSLEMGFSDNKTLTITRDMDQMIRGTLEVLPTHENTVYMSNIEAKLMAMKDGIIASGERYDLEGQVQYVVKTDAGEDFYVDFEDGSWMVASEPTEGMGMVMHTYGDTGERYVGEYLNGSYVGLGRYLDSEGNVTAIKSFDDKDEAIPYTEEKITYLKHMPTLVVLVSFSDERIISSDTTWYDKLFGESTNSLRNYYKEVTHDAINLVPALEQDGHINDGIVRVTLDMPHPNTGGVLGDSEDLVPVIAEQLKNKINMQLYDRNDNGVIDREELAFVAILAGYEASDATPSDYAQFRAHHLFSDMSMGLVDQMGIMNIIYVSEMEYFADTTALSTMGVFAHELGHQLGLPDLYDTDGSSKGLGPFSLMAEAINSYASGDRPGEVIPYFDPWSLIQLGAVTPTIVTASGEYDLNSAETGAYNIIRINTDNPDEYFLLENRTIKGRDAILRNDLKQNGGILIYHIDESVINKNYDTNTVNDNEAHKGIDIEEASERTTGSGLDNDDYNQRLAPFFSASGQALFSGTLTPKSRLYDGSDSGVSIEVLTDGATSRVKITLE
ncbi:MAG: M6 family metalloprotease domain-containing protein [Clostridia bacterium]|nr:M6 family metalloprotease domain-containing protein [Clostridia bacterium]